MVQQIGFFRSLASKKLPFERFQHTIGVEVFAGKLAKKFGIDENSAILAALTHDLGKQFTIQEQLQKAEEWNLLTSPEDKKIPDVIHGRISAYILEHEYDIHDQDVLNAVANHTLGRPGMSDLEMLIYSADLTEPGRMYNGVDKLREKLYHDLKEGTYACVEHTLEYLKNTDRPIHPQTISTYEDLKRRLQVGNQS